MNWIKQNKHLYENLIPGKKYYVFENEPPVLDDGNVILIHSSRSKDGVRRSVVFSENGNEKITKISTCTCGKLREGSAMQGDFCKECQEKNRKAGQAKRFQLRKQGIFPTPKPKKVVKAKQPTAVEIARKITGRYQKVFREEEEYKPDIFFEVEIQTNRSCRQAA